MTPSNQDNETPKVNSKRVHFSNITDSGFTISWEKATDNVTPQDRIRYEISIWNDDDPHDTMHKVCDAWGIDTFTFTGLKAHTHYAYFVEAYDEAGKRLTYTIGKVETLKSAEQRKEQEEKEDLVRRQGIRAFLDKYKYSDRLDRIDVTKGQAPAKEFLVMNGRAMQLMNVEKDIYQPRNDFMPIKENEIYPGRLVFVDEDLVNGRPRSVLGSHLGVGTVTVSVNFLGGNGVSLSEHGIKADYASIQDALSKILDRAFSSGALPPAEAMATSTLSNSKEKVAVDAGCSVDYMGAKCNIDMSVTKAQQSFYQAESFKQGFYTVSVEPENLDSVYYFGKQVTAETLQSETVVVSRHGDGRRVECDYHPIGVISSVTYGRVGFNIKQYSASSFNLKGDESGGYKKVFTAKSTQDIQKSSSSSTHFARIWGGSATTAGSAISKGGVLERDGKDEVKIDQSFTEEMSKNMEVSMRNQGIPIYFTVNYVASGEPVGTYLTGKYSESEYIPLVHCLTVKVRMKATVVHGTDCIALHLVYEYIKLDDNGNVIETGERSKQFKWDNQAEKNTTIELDDHCYFKDNRVFAIIKSKRLGGDWVKCSDGYLNITGGKLTLCLDGSYFSHNVRPKGNMADGDAQYMETDSV